MPNDSKYHFLTRSIDAHGDSNACLLWPFSTTTSGRHGQARYGQVWIPDKQKTFRVHRAAYEYAYGPLPNDEVKVRHSCDVTLCFNPKHLLSGTQKDNIQDAIERGRFLPKGVNHNMAKLTEAQVLEIRELYRIGKGRQWTQKKLAEKFGVGEGCIQCVVERQTWQHV